MSTLAATSGSTYAIERGGAGPTVLLLHGFTGSLRDWDGFRPALERLTGVVAVDLLGHGASDRPADPASHAVERQAADLAALLRSVASTPAHVVGYSFGARVALRLAIDHPDIVGSLFLESPSAGVAEPVARARRRAADEELARLLETEGIAAFIERWEALPMFATERVLAADSRASLRAGRIANDPHALAASLRGAGQGAMAPLDALLGTVTVSTTVLAGALDAVGLDRARSIAGAMPSARLVVIDAVGHAVHREAPGRFARELALHLVTSSEFCTPARSRP